MPTKYVEVQGFATHYFHAGRTTLPHVTPDLSKGQLLLFLHAAGSNGHVWHRQLDFFAVKHSPLAFDFPGHGRSGGTEGLPTISAYRAFLRDFAKKLSLRPFVAVGHSMGGAIAMDLACHYPEMAQALILVATAAKFEIPEKRREDLKRVMQGRMPQQFTTDAFSTKTSMEVMREAWMEQVKTDPRVRYFDVLACAGFDMTDRLSEIGVPTLIVCGQDDAFTPVAQSELLRDRIRGAKMTVIPDAGHMVPMEKPEEFNAAIERFLGTLT